MKGVKVVGLPAEYVGLSHLVEGRSGLVLGPIVGSCLPRSERFNQLVALCTHFSGFVE
jgi:hypothetical protein